MAEQVKKEVGARLFSAFKTFYVATVGKTNTDRLDGVVTRFIQSAQTSGYPPEKIEVFLRTAVDVLGTPASVTPKALAADNFHLRALLRFCHPAVPAKLINALHGLWRYAEINHNSDSLWRLDPYAHVIHALAAMISTAFMLVDPNEEIQYLELVNIFLMQVISSDLISSSSEETFSSVLIPLNTAITETIAQIQADITVSGALKFLDILTAEAKSAHAQIGTLPAALYKNQKALIFKGIAQVEDLEDTFLDCMAEISGFVRPIAQNYAAVIATVSQEDRQSPSKLSVKPEQKYTENTEKFINSVIACTDEPGSQHTQIHVPLDYKNTSAIFPTKPENKQFQQKINFLTTLNTLVKRGNPDFLKNPRISLNANAEIVLITKRELQEESTVLLESGIAKNYLCCQGDSLTTERHRFLILALEVEKFLLINALANLLVLSKSSTQLYVHFGNIGGALFLKALFPAMDTLIIAAEDKLKLVIQRTQVLSAANAELAKINSDIISSLEFLRQALRKMSNAAVSSGRCNIKALQALEDGEISLSDDLRQIANSLFNCRELFHNSGFLEQPQRESLDTHVRALKEQLSVATAYDGVYSISATVVSAKGSLTLGPVQEMVAQSRRISDESRLLETKSYSAFPGSENPVEIDTLRKYLLTAKKDIAEKNNSPDKNLEIYNRIIRELTPLSARLQENEKTSSLKAEVDTILEYLKNIIKLDGGAGVKELKKALDTCFKKLLKKIERLSSNTQVVEMVSPVTLDSPSVTQSRQIADVGISEAIIAQPKVFLGVASETVSSAGRSMSHHNRSSERANTHTLEDDDVEVPLITTIHLPRSTQYVGTFFPSKSNEISPATKDSKTDLSGGILPKIQYSLITDGEIVSEKRFVAHLAGIKPRHSTKDYAELFIEGMDEGGVFIMYYYFTNNPKNFNAEKLSTEAFIENYQASRVFAGSTTISQDRHQRLFAHLEKAQSNFDQSTKTSLDQEKWFLKLFSECGVRLKPAKEYDPVDAQTRTSCLIL